MFLHAAFTPPHVVLEAISQAVQSAVAPLPKPDPPPEPRRSPFGRLGGHSVQTVEPRVATAPARGVIAEGHLNVPIAGFGNVTMRDAMLVVGALKEEGVRWATPTVHFAGATVQEIGSHSCVVMKLDGEVAELQTVARAVTQSVQRLGLRFDRRKFLPLIPVATIGATATSSEVMAFLNALEGFQGEPWTVDHVSLMKRSFDTTSMDYQEYQTIWLGR
jgi:2'-5' RNA ligase